MQLAENSNDRLYYLVLLCLKERTYENFNILRQVISFVST